MKLSKFMGFLSKNSANKAEQSDETLEQFIKYSSNKSKDEILDLNNLLIQHPASTFFARVSGESQFAGISSGDIVVVDTIIEPQEGNTVCVASNDDIFLKRLIFIDNKMFLESADGEIEAINPDNLLSNKIFGIVTKIIHSY